MSYRHIEPRVVLAKQNLAAGTLVGQKHDMRTMTRGALQFNIGAGLTAAISVFASVDNINFFDLQLGIPNQVGPVSWGVDLTAYGYPYYEPQVTQAAGSGTIEVWANAKGS